MSSLPPPRPGPPPPPGYTNYGEHLRPDQGALAGFWIRFLAVLLDSIILGIPFAILGVVTGATDTTTRDARKQTWHDNLVSTVVVKV